MDYYDEAVAYLTEHPEEIQSAWCGDGWKPKDEHPAHWLFAHASKDGTFCQRDDEKSCGCLTQISFPYSRMVAWTDELTSAIKADKRLPTESSKIRVKHLNLFAEWQRKIDAALGRTPPVWTTPEPTP